MGSVRRSGPLDNADFMSLEGRNSKPAASSLPVMPGPGLAAKQADAKPVASIPLQPAKTGDTVRCTPPACCCAAASFQRGRSHQNHQMAGPQKLPGCDLIQDLLCYRDKARLLLAEALAMAAGEVPEGEASARAVNVEQAILMQNGAVNQKYKAKLRSLSFNLKDAKNPDLRRRVLAGEVSGDVTSHSALASSPSYTGGSTCSCADLACQRC